MRYLSRGWHNGDLTDEEADRASRDYATRLQAIAARLPESMVLLRDGVSLHDAIIESVRWKPSAKELRMTLVAGTSEAGYRTVDMVYQGAMLGQQRVASLRRAACDREACVLYVELDIEDDVTLVHRLLFWPTEEVAIDLNIRNRARWICS